MNRLLAQHATPHRHRGVEGQKVKVKAKEAGGVSRQHLRQPQAEASLASVLHTLALGAAACFFLQGSPHTLQLSYSQSLVAYRASLQVLRAYSCIPQ